MRAVTSGTAAPGGEHDTDPARQAKAWAEPGQDAEISRCHRDRGPARDRHDPHPLEPSELSERAFFALTPVDLAKVNGRGPQTIGGHGRQLVGEIRPRRVNAERSDRKGSAYHQRIDFRYDQCRNATDLHLPGEAHDRPQLAPRHKLTPARSRYRTATGMMSTEASTC